MKSRPRPGWPTDRASDSSLWLTGPKKRSSAIQTPKHSRTHVLSSVCTDLRSGELCEPLARPDALTHATRSLVLQGQADLQAGRK